LIFRALFLGELLFEFHQRFLQSFAAHAQNLNRQQPGVFAAPIPTVATGTPGAIPGRRTDLKPSVPAGHHPHHQRAGAAKAGHENEQDDLQLMFALVARQMREQQLARAFYKIFSHGNKVLNFPPPSGMAGLDHRLKSKHHTR